VAAGNYLINWLNGVINEHETPKEAFRSTPVSIGFQVPITSVPKNINSGNLGSSPGINLSRLDNLAQNDYLGYQSIDLSSATASINDFLGIPQYDDYAAVLYSNQSEGLDALINGCFVGNKWKYERLGFITSDGIVVLPGSGAGWSNAASDCGASLFAGIKAGVIDGNKINIDGNSLSILGSIHIHPSCDQLVAIGKIEKLHCDELYLGPNGFDAQSLSSYGNYFVYDFNRPDVFYEGRGQYPDKNYARRTLSFNTNFNFIQNCGW
jgi:hypothetical protein